MPFSINNFRAQLQGQGARPNLFEVTIPFPGAVNPGEATQKITFMCKGAQIPGADIGLVASCFIEALVSCASLRLCSFSSAISTGINGLWSMVGINLSFR